MPRLSLRAKLLTSFILILLPIFLLLIYGYHEANERRIVAVLDNQTRTAEAVAALVDVSFDEAFAVAWALTNDPLVYTFDQSQLDTHLQRLAPYYPQYETLSIINTGGDNVGSSLPFPPDIQRLRLATDRPYFQQLMATGEPVISPVLISRRTFRPTVVVVVPLRAEENKTIGAVLVTLYLEALSDRLTGVTLQSEQHILLADTTGTAAFHTALPELPWEQRNLGEFEPVEAAVEGRATGLRRYVSPLLGDSRIGAFFPTPKYGWVVGVSIQENVALAPVRLAMRDQLLGFGAVALLSVVLALIASNLLLQPIRRLTGHALALGQGDLKQRVEIKTGDELEKLGQTFNEMAESLGRTLEERQALGKVAEALVRELSLERVADIVVEQGQRVLRASTVALYLADLEREELRLLAQRGLTPQSVAEIGTLPFTAPLLSTQAARTGQPQEVADALDVSAELASARRLAEREGQLSIFAQPLLAKERLVGVLTLAKPSPHQFTEWERALIRAFADLCAAAVENARLYEGLQETLHLREEFISAAAHELRTPITTIKGYVQAMDRWAPGGHEPREAVALEVINRQCDRINRRVQEMMEAIRLRRVPPEQHRVPFDLGDLAAEVVQHLQATTPLHRLVLQHAAPAPVEADREQIEEVLVSLVDNAIKFSPKGGDIEVRVFAKDKEAIVAVRDYGVGIPKERQVHVFEPFYEAVPAGEPGYRGVVALSLYLSKLIVERHRGRIWFESEVGKGSTFSFTLLLA